MKSDYPYLGQGRIKKYNNYTFKDFMEAVDQGCQGQFGCSAHDLPDYPYHDDWEICQEDLAFVAPEDHARRAQVFRNHVGYTVDEVKNENDLDVYPYL